MKTSWTRRRFLAVAGASATASLVGTGSAAGTGRGAVFGGAARRALRALADEIVPAGGEMPSASAAGAIRYLTDLAARHEIVRTQLQAALAAAEEAARSLHSQPVDRLAGAQRVTILREMERARPDVFVPLRNLVYEAYYTQPVVAQGLGFAFRGAEESGPAPEAFEEALLERVRAIEPFYRRAR